MSARTRARLGPYCCELIPILIGPLASAVEVEVNQTRSAVTHRISVVVFITRAPPATRRTAQSCRGDATRSATSPKAILLARGAYRRFRTAEHAVDEQRSR